ncbi:alpha/beta fold hydrolase [Methylococcus capsulatus]|jgi:pimeloyl-ACP methyl ester carboxylesterase|uniref:Hydrolase, alpha/beta fold family n=1 Tax=Methylococcus capsulatus (strain ATCC 33009 / NCIMB 11132 / Bath) TaxID=243233 RepID=Q60BU6_METCA|nr:alpha/beta hydrolase [Methylococcus capsulatus]AAU90518.1 hydrolase, alpha/beta fold family [Methylococcus capsulatus str. Bath]QXP89822.1 alpha/beta hydrolase [Methylococcus capsulatus]
MSERTGPAEWVFIRGLVRESAHWDGFPQVFSGAVPGARVRTVDLPGNGRHWRLDSPLSIRETMEFARAELGTEAGMPRYLLALSLGAMVALEWIARHPREIAGAVLINTSLSSLSPLYRRLNWRVWPEVVRALLTADVAARERAILRLTSRSAAEEPLRVLARAEVYRQRPIRKANVFRQLWAAAHYRPSAETPAVPVLVLGSRGDRLVCPECSEAIARHWGLPLKMHPDAGHDLPLDDPAWTVEAILAWLGTGPEREPDSRG